MRIALAQINPTVGDLVGNQEKILDYIHRAEKQDADIIVFPELAVCGYPPEDLLYKDHFVEDNIKILHSLAKKVSNSIVIVGFVDKDKKKNLYNAAAIIDKGKVKGVYHKQELPNYGVFDEKRYFHQGKIEKVFKIMGVLVGVNICEDIWKEKGICQRQARQGTKLLINISSSPYDVDKLAAREKLLKSRAEHMRAYVCYCNLVGGQDELAFDGGSLIVDPRGNIVAFGKAFEEDLVIADLNISGIKPEIQKKAIKVHLSERTSQIERIYRALVLGTHDYIRKNNFEKAVVGLSGGIDSSVVTTIAVEAIGKENVIGVTMPSRFTSQETKIDAQKLADNLGVRFIEIPIERIFEVYKDVLSGAFAGLPSDVAEENIQARIRGNILMALSNKFGWLVLTTGNKSEVAVGYCTLYGDMSGGFSVIKDVPKTTVYDLAKFINEQKGKVIPQSVIQRAPTAELRADQKDQDSLPPYEILDDLLKRYVENHESLGRISRGENKDLVKKVIQMVDKSEYKRRQAPPGVKITPRAFGKDWRLPITNRYKEF